MRRYEDIPSETLERWVSVPPQDRRDSARAELNYRREAEFDMRSEDDGDDAAAYADTAGERFL